MCSMCWRAKKRCLYLTHCGLVTSYGFIELGQHWAISSGDGLVPDATKILPEPMLTYHQQGPLAFIWGHYHKKFWRYIPLSKARLKIIFFIIASKSSRGQWFNRCLFDIILVVYEYRSTHEVHILTTLRWRHNEHDGVSNHQPHGCLLNRLFRRRSKKTSKLRVTGLCVGNSPGPVNSPHKRPVTRKMLPFDDVIMRYNWHATKQWLKRCSAMGFWPLIIRSQMLLWHHMRAMASHIFANSTVCSTACSG